VHRKRIKKEARLVDSSAPLFQSMRKKSQRIVGETSERSSGVWSKSVFARMRTKHGDQGLWLPAGLLKSRSTKDSAVSTPLCEHLPISPPTLHLLQKDQWPILFTFITTLSNKIFKAFLRNSVSCVQRVRTGHLTCSDVSQALQPWDSFSPHRFREQPGL
jgi:hypothetical protein